MQYLDIHPTNLTCRLAKKRNLAIIMYSLCSTFVWRHCSEAQRVSANNETGFDKTNTCQPHIYNCFLGIVVSIDFDYSF